MFGFGESLALRAGKTEGLDDYSAVFALPLSARGTLLTVRYDHTKSKVVEAPLDQLDIGAKSTAWDVTVSHPLYERLNRVITGTVTLARRHTYSTFLGDASPFIPGAPDGRTVISVARFGLDGVERTQTDVVAGRMLVSRGVEALNATIVDDRDLPDSRFTALLGQFQWVRLLSPAGQLILRADGQWSSEPLLGSEKYSIGGLDSVRAYRRDYAIRDKGWFTSLEYRHLIANLPVRANPAPNEGAVRLAAFVDYAQAWDINGPGSDGDENRRRRARHPVGTGTRRGVRFLLRRPDHFRAADREHVAGSRALFPVHRQPRVLEAALALARCEVRIARPLAGERRPQPPGLLANTQLVEQERVKQPIAETRIRPRPGAIDARAQLRSRNPELGPAVGHLPSGQFGLHLPPVGLPGLERDACGQGRRSGRGARLRATPCRSGP